MPQSRDEDRGGEAVQQDQGGPVGASAGNTKISTMDDVSTASASAVHAVRARLVYRSRTASTAQPADPEAAVPAATRPRVIGRASTGVTTR